MKQKVMMIIILLILPFSIQAANDRRVEKVYTCGKDVGLLIEGVGWVVARDSEIGETRVDRILSIGLTLVATQNPVGFINPTPLSFWCGISDLQSISVIQIERP